MNFTYKSILFLLILLFFIRQFGISQEVILEGGVFDEANEPIPGVLVSVVEKDTMIHYQFSGAEGEFHLKIDTTLYSWPIRIKASSFFYKDTVIIVNTIPTSPILIFMGFENNELDEFVVETTSINNDTTSLNFQKYNIQKLESLEESLKKIPGISVDKDGRIKYWNREIEKILIDGEDLANRQYTFISKNLRSEVIDDVELLKNFEENTVLKNSQRSDKIALNLKIKEEFQNVWFGNLASAFGMGSGDNEVKQAANIGLLKKKIKLLDAFKYSTLGAKAIPFNVNYSDNSIIDKPLYSAKSLDIPLPVELTNNNKALGNTFLLNKKIKNTDFRITHFLGRDIQKQESFRSLEFFFDDQESFSETNNYLNKNLLLSGEVELKNSHLDNKYYTNKFNYTYGSGDYSSNSLFSSNRTEDRTKNNDVSLSNQFQFTNQLKNGLVLDNELAIGASFLNETADVASDDLRNFLNDESLITQKVNNDFQYITLKSKIDHFISDRVKTRLGLNFDKSHQEILIDFEPDPNTYQNEQTFRRTQIGLSPTLVYDITNSIELNSSIQSTYASFQNWNDLLFNYRAELYIKFFGNLQMSYSRNQELPKNEFFLERYYLVNNNSFKRGGLFFSPLDYEQFKTSLTNQNKRSTFNNEISFTHRRSKSTLLQEFTATDNINFNNGIQIFREGTDDLLKEQLVILINNLVFNIETSHTFFRTPLSNDPGELNRIYSSDYRLEISSYFSKTFNFSLTSGYQKSVQKFGNKSSVFDTKNLSVDLDWEILEDVALNLNGGIYEVSDTIYKIFNSSIEYTPENKRISYGLYLNNILNEDEFSFQARNSFFYSFSSIPLVPRYILFQINYTF